MKETMLEQKDYGFYFLGGKDVLRIFWGLSWKTNTTRMVFYTGSETFNIFMQ